MHMPDGLINAPVSIGAAVIAAGAITVGLKKSKGTLDSQTAPLAGLVAVYLRITNDEFPGGGRNKWSLNGWRVSFNIGRAIRCHFGYDCCGFSAGLSFC